MLTRPAGVMVSLVTVIAFGLGLVLVPASEAEAKVCGWIVVGGDMNYVVCEPGDDDTGTKPPGGGDTEPTCDLDQDPFDQFCEGTSACWGNNPAANDEEAVAEELGPKPDDPDAHVAFKDCRRADGSTYHKWYWATADDGATLSELAQRAFGRLKVPAFTPTFNPPTRTFVNLDTWWWAEGATTADVVGSAALGVRALATPDHMEVDPGDGSEVFSCDFATSKSDECIYTYRRASNRGSATAPDGSKAYAARMRLVYNVHFEHNGNPLKLDGLPTGLTGDWSNTAVPVREIQTVVIPRR